MNLSPEHLRWWVQTEKPGAVFDAYDLETLTPTATLAAREAALRPILPGWFWGGEPGSRLLSVGPGRAYFERKHGRGFETIYAVEMTERGRFALQLLPMPNCELLGASLFEVSWRHRVTPMARYGWFNACIHELFREFHGWEFMWKLAMLVSDTVVIDGGIFDAGLPRGRALLEGWRAEEPHGGEPFEVRRAAEFSFAGFLRSLGRMWEVVSDVPSPWADGEARTVVVKRLLPPRVPLSEIGVGDRVVKAHDFQSSVYRNELGYYKRSDSIGTLLMYDAVSKVMGWDDMVRCSVYDGDDFCGFVVKDFGDRLPDVRDPRPSEQLFIALARWTLPLGLLPADVARENIRMIGDRPVWIDIDLVGLREIDTRTALWLAANIYKEYESGPPVHPRPIESP